MQTMPETVLKSTGITFPDLTTATTANDFTGPAGPRGA